MYGQLPSGRDRPTLIPVASEEAKEIDKERKSALVRGKVRATMSAVTSVHLFPFQAISQSVERN